MKQTLFIVGILLIAISCQIRSENKAAKANISDSLNSSVPENIKTDTLQFNSINEFHAYYNDKHDSIELLRQELLKSEIQFTPNSLILIDSLFTEYKSEHRKSAYYLALRKHKTQEDLKVIFLLVHSYSINTDEINSVFNLFPESERVSPLGKHIQRQIDERKKRESKQVLSQDLMNFSFLSENGERITLQSIESKYLLLEFWASWCSPCRSENIELKKLYSGFKSKPDVRIITISLDTKENIWKKALEQDKLDFINICDLNGWNAKIAKELLIEAIPYNILINKDGKILAYNLKNEKLINFVNTLP